MALNISRGVVQKAQKVVCYGPEGIGKSTFAAQFPEPLFIDTEGSTNHMDVARLPRPSSWTMLLSNVTDVKNTPGCCKTLVVDTIDWAEQLCVNYVCATYNKKGVEDFGYGKGYVFVKEEIGRFLNLLTDVIDPEDVEGEGDPVDLAVGRARTFKNRKIFKPSTPTIKGASRIEVDYEASDKRRYFVPCPECGHMHILVWGNFVIPIDEKTGKKNPKDAYRVCPECGSIIREHHKTYMFEHGEWRVTAPENADPKKRGYHISTLYSPLGIFSWAECADSWIKAQKRQSRRKTFVNTILGETWEELGEGTDAETLLGRRERYNCEVPQAVLVLTCSVDTQDNRLEYEVKGWGLNREKWGIQYGVIMGDPGRAETWADLDGVLQRKFIREDGLQMKIATTCIDSGGHHAKAVYVYCKKREMWRVWAIKGRGGSGIPFIFRPKKKNPAGVWLFMVGVDVGKDSIASDLMLSEPGPSYCHYPIEELKGYGRNYFEGLTSERRRLRYIRGRASIAWEKRYEGARNEPLDLENYNLAAIEILNPNMELLAEMQGNGSAATPKPQNGIKKRRVLSSGVSV